MSLIGTPHFVIHDFSTAALQIAASGQSEQRQVEQFNGLEVLVDITAVSGTSPTLDLTIEYYDPDIDDWVALYTKQYTTTTSTPDFVQIPVFYQNVRASWVIGGTDTPYFRGKIVASGKQNGIFSSIVNNLRNMLPVKVIDFAAAYVRSGGLIVALAEKIAGEDLTRKFIRSFAPSTFTVFSASTTIVTGAGNLRGMTLVAGTAGDTVTIYDNTADSGTKIMETYTVEASPIFPKNFDFKDGAFSTGCRVTVTGTGIKGTIETIGNYS